MAAITNKFAINYLNVLLHSFRPSRVKLLRQMIDFHLGVCRIIIHVFQQQRNKLFGTIQDLLPDIYDTLISVYLNTLYFCVDFFLDFERLVLSAANMATA